MQYYDNKKAFEFNWIKRGAFGFGIPFWVAMSALFLAKERWDSRLTVQIAIMAPISLGAGALWGWFMRRTLMRKHRFSVGHCRSCGYSLRGLAGNICPECGFEFDPHDGVTANPFGANDHERAS